MRLMDKVCIGCAATLCVVPVPLLATVTAAGPGVDAAAPMVDAVTQVAAQVPAGSPASVILAAVAQLVPLLCYLLGRRHASIGNGGPQVRSPGSGI